MKILRPVWSLVILTTAIISASSIALPEPAYANACTTSVEPDFDGDGIRDLAIADADASVGNVEYAGRIHIVDGAGADALTLTANDIPGLGAEDEGGFGSVMETFDSNSDGCTDLVVGSPNADVEGKLASGLVVVIPGGPSGLDAANAVVWHQNSPGVPGAVEAGDLFGFSLAAGATRTGEPFLIIGAPGEDVANASNVNRPDAGAFLYFRGASKLLIHQDTPGVPGALEAGDEYGFSVAASRTHVAVGSPHEAEGTEQNTGALDLFSHASNGTLSVVSHVTQDEPGMSGDGSAGDYYAKALSMTDYIAPETSSLGTMLAVGVPGESVSSGRVVLVRVTSAGVVSEHADIRQGVAGVADQAETGDWFGGSVQLVNRAPAAAAKWQSVLLAVGVEAEDTASISDHGGVQVFSVVGPPGDHDAWAQDAGMAEAGWIQGEHDYLGHSLAVTKNHLYIADPSGTRPAVYGIPWGNLTGESTGAVSVISPGVQGIPIDGVEWFGGELA